MNYSPTVHKKAKRKYALLVTFKGLQYGALAGFIASSLISLAIAGAELAFGLPIGTFYSVIGIILGLNNAINASYLGFGLHLLIGILLGTALGAIGIRWEKIRSLMLIPYKSSLFGVGAGIVIWLILFLPITTLLIQPSIQRIVVILAIAWQKPVLADQLSNSITNIALTGIVFHLVWGALFGFSISSLLRTRVYKIKQHYKDIISIDPNIRLVTICDTNGNILFYRHRQGVKNLLSEDESRKSLEMAMYSWKIREGLSDKIGKGMYVLAEYEKIKRITLPFGDHLLLYLTTEVEADHSNIYDRIRRLEAGLKY
ncbi:MAG TPA: hypothetical protein VEL11_09865 [Candidatus Bathyarchaeia archaeon]|nr:hypothetical protein [Candidatus Bathyarchaeia archaeon]